MTIVISYVNWISRYQWFVPNDQLRQAICAHVVQILREKRVHQRMSMNRLAQRAGLSQSMISLIEHDLRNPTLDTLLRMTDALGLDLADVIKQSKVAALSRPRD